MEEKLESFVNLLNRQRQARAVPEELAKLPNWAQRELSKHPEATPPRKTPPRQRHVPRRKPKPRNRCRGETRRAADAEGGDETGRGEAGGNQAARGEARRALPPHGAGHDRRRSRARSAELARALPRGRNQGADAERRDASQGRAVVIESKAVGRSKRQRRRPRGKRTPRAPEKPRSKSRRPPSRGEKTGGKIAPEKIRAAREKTVEKKIDTRRRQGQPRATSMRPAEIAIAASHRRGDGIAARASPAAFRLAAAAVIAVVRLGGRWLLVRAPAELVAANKITKPTDAPAPVAKNPAADGRDDTPSRSPAARIAAKPAPSAVGRQAAGARQARKKIAVG